jgi:hypothetical protein
MGTSLSDMYCVPNIDRDGSMSGRYVDMLIRYIPSMYSYEASLGSCTMRVSEQAIAGGMTWEYVRNALINHNLHRKQYAGNPGASYFGQEVTCTPDQVGECAPSVRNTKSENKKVRRTLCSDHLWN